MWFSLEKGILIKADDNFAMKIAKALKTIKWKL